MEVALSWETGESRPLLVSTRKDGIVWMDMGKYIFWLGWHGWRKGLSVLTACGGITSDPSLQWKRSWEDVRIFPVTVRSRSLSRSLPLITEWMYWECHKLPTWSTLYLAYWVIRHTTIHDQNRTRTDAGPYNLAHSFSVAWQYKSFLLMRSS